MRYLSLFVPAKQLAAPPSAEHMAAMGKLVEEEMRAGRLEATGGLARRDAGGFIVTREGGAFRVENAPADWMRAGGFAILAGETREEVIAGVHKFLDLVGDGRCEVLEIVTPPQG